MAEVRIYTDNGYHLETFQLSAFPRDLTGEGLFTSRLKYALIQALVKERNEEMMPT